MRQVLQTIYLFELGIETDNMLQTLEEPIVNLGQFMYTLHAISFIHSLRYSENALVCRCFKRGIQIIDMEVFILRKSMHSLTNHSETLLDSIFECATNSHYFTYGLHGTTQLAVHAAELTQVPARNLTNNIVQRRFEEGRGRLCHRVFQFKQSVSKTKFGRHECQRITGSLGSQSGRAAKPRIDLDDTIVFRFGVKSILYVTLAHNTQMAYDTNSQRTEFMIFGVGKCLRRSNDDRLAGMNAQRVEILHIADRDTVVISVAHHFVFYLFPALERFLYQYLRRERECFLHHRIQFLLVIAKTGTESSQSIGSTDDNRITEFRSCTTSLFNGLASFGFDRFHIYLV